MEKLKKFIKNKKYIIFISIIIFSFLSIILFQLFFNDKNKNEENNKVDLEYSYLEKSINVNNFLNGLTNIDEKKDTNKTKVYDWLSDLNKSKKEGLETLNTDDYTYVYYGIKCNENESLGFEYGNSYENESEVHFKIYKKIYTLNNDEKNEHTYANTVFAIEKTNKKIVIDNE